MTNGFPFSFYRYQCIKNEKQTEFCWKKQTNEGKSVKNVIPVEKSLPEETKNVSRLYLGKSLWNDENIDAIIRI